MGEANVEWLLYVFGSAVFVGLTAVLSGIGVKNADSDLAIAVHTVVVLVFSRIMVFLTGPAGPIRAISAKTYLFLVSSGVATGASWLLYFRALQLEDVNKMASIDRSNTILTMFLAILILGEGLRGMKILCMVLIGTGTLMMIQKRNQGMEETGNRGWLEAVPLSAAFASLTVILGGTGIQGVESSLGTAIHTCVVLIMTWLLVLLQGKQKHLDRAAPKSWCSLVTSRFTTGASWLCYYRALQEGPAGAVVPIDKLSILVTVLFSRIFLRERPDRKSFASLVLLTAGTSLLLLQGSKRRDVREEEKNRTNLLKAAVPDFVYIIYSEYILGSLYIGKRDLATGGSR